MDECLPYSAVLAAFSDHRIETPKRRSNRFSIALDCSARAGVMANTAPPSTAMRLQRIYILPSLWPMSKEALHPTRLSPARRRPQVLSELRLRLLPVSGLTPDRPGLSIAREGWSRWTGLDRCQSGAMQGHGGSRGLAPAPVLQSG